MGLEGFRASGLRVQGVDIGDWRFRDVRNYSNAGKMQLWATCRKHSAAFLLGSEVGPETRKRESARPTPKLQRNPE